jgi:Flp pilus assembly secretin CpaC
MQTTLPWVVMTWWVAMAAWAGPPEKAPTPNPAVAPEAEEPLVLRVGTQRVLTVKGLERAAIGDPAVADVQPGGDGALRVGALGVGRTTLLAWLADGTRKRWEVSVVGAETRLSADPGVALREMTPATSDTLALKVKTSLARSVPGLARLAISDAAVAHVSVEGEKVLVEGLSPGHTTVLLWLQNGERRAWRVEVSAP